MSLPTRRLGKDGPEVTGLGLGLMSLGSAYGPAGSDEERLVFLDKACELGARNWDSADIYGDTEDLLGKWFKRSGKRHDVFLSTKFGYQSDFVSVRSDPAYVKEACENSLRKLGVGYIDLFYCHRVDKTTPVEKTVEAMVELKK
jgi:aryl-alcohol dehydrogenase-like predicted oxidoreductase